MYLKHYLQFTKNILLLPLQVERYGLNLRDVYISLTEHRPPPHCVPAATGRNENWNKSQAVVQVYRPSQGKSKHLVASIHTQLHPPEEKWLLLVIVPVDGQDTKKSFSPHGNGMPSPTNKGRRLSCWDIAGQEWVGKRKTKVAPASFLERYGL